MKIRINTDGEKPAQGARFHLFTVLLTALCLLVLVPIPMWAQETCYAEEQAVEVGVAWREKSVMSERILAGILKAAPTGIGMAENRIIVEVNDYIPDLTGYSREELVGRNARMLYPTLEESDFVGREKYRQMSEKGSGSVETRWLRKDGGIRNIILSSTPLDPKNLSVGVIFTVLDITERKQARERFVRVFESSPAALIVSDAATGLIIDANQRTSDILGHEVVDMLGRTTVELGIWRNAGVRKHFLEKLSEQGFVRDEPVVLHAKSGEKRSVRWSTEMVEWDGRKVLVSSILDETERVKAETTLASRTRWFLTGLAAFVLVLLALVMRLIVSLRQRKIAMAALYESRENLATTLHSIGDGVIVTDKQGLVINMNPIAEKLCGRTLLEAGGRPLIEVFNIVNALTSEAAEDPVKKALESDNVVVLANHTMLLSGDGGRYHIADSAAPIRDREGGVTGVVLVFSDVTEKYAREEAVKAEREQLLSVFNSIDEMIYISDPETYEILYVNRKLANVLSEYCVGGKCYEMLQGLVAPCEFCTNSIILKQKHKPHKWEHYNPKLDMHFAIVDRIIQWSDGRDVRFEIAVDITSLKQAEERKEKLQAQLNQAQKMESVGRLAGGVAHDFNNMLSIILGHTEMAFDLVDPVHPIHAELEQIQKAAHRSSNLVRQLMAFARKQTISPRMIDLNETVGDMLKMLQRLMGEDIDLTWKPDNRLWSVKMDSGQIDQILANLCVNARDAIAGVGKVIIETKNDIFDEDYCTHHAGFIPGEYVLLAVSDNGCGMDSETMLHLFEPFFTTKEVGKGTGLGLATIYGIVKQNKGFINVYSELGWGTTFRIYLPRYEPETQFLPEPPPVRAAVRGNETILLVEDEPEILKITKVMLEKLGYAVLAANSPGEAIRLAETHSGQIHLLITDVVMPEMNGRDLARNLVSIYPDIERLFMSGYTADIITSYGILDDGVNFIQKPFSMKDLAAKVREALESSESDRAQA